MKRLTLAAALMLVAGPAFAQQAPSDPLVQQLVSDYMALGVANGHVQRDMQKLLEAYQQQSAALATSQRALACWEKDAKACEAKPAAIPGH